MRTTVYVDGFNLYYRMLRANPQYKWLNPVQLAQNILRPENVVTRLNYYTARVSSRAYDPDAPARQATYLEALVSVPEIAIHQGSFLTSEPWMPLAQPPEAKPTGYVWTQPTPDRVKVVKTEEKGSDVNLATHLVRDAFLNTFDVAVLITNDSDLVEPIRVVIQETGKPVGLLVPTRYPTASLAQAASFYRHIRTGHLAASQFANPVLRADGTQIMKPASWSGSDG